MIERVLLLCERGVLLLVIRLLQHYRTDCMERQQAYERVIDAMPLLE